MKYLAPVVIILIYGLSSIIHGEETDKLNLDLEKAITMAQKYSEELQIADFEEKIMYQRYKEVKSSVFPHLNGEITWTHYPYVPEKTISMMGLSYTTPIKKDYENNLTLTATQLLWSFGQVSAAINLSNKALKISKLKRDKSFQEISYYTKMAYYNVLFTKNLVKITKNSYQNALKNKELFNKRTHFGRASKGELIKIEADIASRIPALKEAQGQLALAQKSLKRMLGILNNKEIILTTPLSDDFVDFDKDKMVLQQESKSPTLKILKQSVGLNEDLIDIKKSSFLPTLSAFGSLSYFGESDKAIFEGDDMNSLAAVGLKLNIPLWNGGEKISQYRQAVLEKNKAIIEEKKMSRDLKLLLEKSIIEYNSLIQSYKSNVQAVKLASESFLLFQGRFESGKSSVVELNDAERMLSMQKIQKESTLFKIYSLKVMIQKLSS